jgi:hypothetical protein
MERKPNPSDVSVEQGDPGDHPAQDAAAHSLDLEGVEQPEVKKGLVLLPRCWVVEHRVAWTARCRRLARHDERLPKTLAGCHFLAFAFLLRKRFVELML